MKILLKRHLGSPLKNGMLRLDEPTSKEIALAIVDGLSALHENDIVHRDIKPQNILRCDDTWKIADFGISKLTNKPVTGYTFQECALVPWAPREQIDGAPAHPSADIYAFGRVLAFLLTGSTKMPDVSLLPVHWAQVVGPCLSESPEKRPDSDWLAKQISAISI